MVFASKMHTQNTLIITLEHHVHVQTFLVAFLRPSGAVVYVIYMISFKKYGHGEASTLNCTNSDK